MIFRSVSVGGAYVAPFAMYATLCKMARCPGAGASIRLSVPSREKLAEVLSVLVLARHGTVARFHHTSIRPHLGAMMAFSDSLFCFKGRPVAHSDSRSWLDQRHIPEHPGMRTSPRSIGASPTKLFIIAAGAETFSISAISPGLHECAVWPAQARSVQRGPPVFRSAVFS